MFLELLENEKYDEIIKIESNNPVFLSIKTLAYAKLRHYYECVSLADTLQKKKYIPSFKFVEDVMFEIGDLKGHLKWKKVEGNIFAKYDNQDNEVEVVYKVEIGNLGIEKLRQFDRIDVLLVLVEECYRRDLFQKCFYFLDVLLDVCLELDKVRVKLKEVEIYDVWKVVKCIRKIKKLLSNEDTTIVHKDSLQEDTIIVHKGSTISHDSSSLDLDYWLNITPHPISLRNLKVKIDIFLINNF